jgi:hypothetical protein
VRKDDDLSRLTGFRQPCSDLVATQMIERRDGIIENDRRLRIDRRQLSEESCKRDTAMFAFAQNLANRLARLVDEPHLKERYACRSFRLLKLDGQAGDV